LKSPWPDYVNRSRLGHPIK